MWKTRFEMSNNHNNGLIHRRNHPSTSTIYHRYYSRRLPTVPRVRDDSPSAIVRPSPPSSIPNLEILIEEDEDIQYTNLTTNEQSNFFLPKQHSSQLINKYQIVLPTIIESSDDEQNKSHQIINDDDDNDKQKKYHIKYQQQDSFLTNNHAMNTNKNNQTIELTIDKRINELLHQKNDRQNKLICLSTDINTKEMIRSNRFKDISAFFENKTIANIFEQKKMIRAKRSVILNRSMVMNNEELTKFEILSKIENESNVFHHQIKRIKTTHQFQIDSIENQSKQFSKNINESFFKKILINQWLIILLFIIIIVSYLTNIYQDLFHNSSKDLSAQQSNQSIWFITNNFIFRYGQFIQHYFFSSIDLLMTLIGRLLFRIDKHEYKNNIVYVASSTYEQLYDWFIHLFKE